MQAFVSQGAQAICAVIVRVNMKDVRLLAGRYFRMQTPMWKKAEGSDWKKEGACFHESGSQLGGKVSLVNSTRDTQLHFSVKKPAPVLPF